MLAAVYRTPKITTVMYEPITQFHLIPCCPQRKHGALTQCLTSYDYDLLYLLYPLFMNSSRCLLPRHMSLGLSKIIQTTFIQTPQFTGIGRVYAYSTLYFPMDVISCDNFHVLQFATVNRLTVLLRERSSQYQHCAVISTVFEL